MLYGWHGPSPKNSLPVRWAAPTRTKLMFFTNFSHDSRLLRTANIRHTGTWAFKTQVFFNSKTSGPQVQSADFLPSTQAGWALLVPAIWPFLQAQRAVCQATVFRGRLLSRSRATISHVPATSWPGGTRIMWVKVIGLRTVARTVTSKPTKLFTQDISWLILQHNHDIEVWTKLSLFSR